MLEVEPHRPALEVLAPEDALLVEQAGAEREPCLLVASRDPYLVAHLRRLAQHEVLPVGPPPGLESPESPVASEQHLVGGIAHRGAVVALVLSPGPIRLALELGELRPVHHRNQVHRLLHARVRVVGDAGSPYGALSRGDEHDTVGAARAVDRSGRRVLQDFDRLDVVGIEVADPSGHRDPVEHIERIVGRLERAVAADSDAEPVSRFVAADGDVHARDAALQRVDGVHRSGALHVGARYRGDRSCHVPPRLRAVTHDHNLLEGHG